MKDIVAESAASYISVLQISEKAGLESEGSEDEAELPTAFSLAKFIPLLKERIHVISPFTRTFLVSWLTLLDTIPDLELVTYLPEFLGGLIKFLGDPNRDVNVATQDLLERFLAEIKRIARIKKGIAESRKGQEGNRPISVTSDGASIATDPTTETDKDDHAIQNSEDDSAGDDEDTQVDGDWIPGQDVQVDYAKILDILVSYVDTSHGKGLLVMLCPLRTLYSLKQMRKCS